MPEKRLVEIICLPVENFAYLVDFSVESSRFFCLLVEILSTSRLFIISLVAYVADTSKAYTHKSRYNDNLRPVGIYAKAMIYIPK